MHKLRERLANGRENATVSESAAGQTCGCGGPFTSRHKQKCCCCWCWCWCWCCCCCRRCCCCCCSCCCGSCSCFCCGGGGGKLNVLDCSRRKNWQVNMLQRQRSTFLVGALLKLAWSYAGSLKAMFLQTSLGLICPMLKEQLIKIVKEIGRLLWLCRTTKVTGLSLSKRYPWLFGGQNNTRATSVCLSIVSETKKNMGDNCVFLVFVCRCCCLYIVSSFHGLSSQPWSA